MKTVPQSGRDAGFALIITLSLLALLVLAVLGLSSLTRINSQVASAAVQQTQARQNALLGLNFAFGQLQRYAGQDNIRLTGIAGITGTGAGAAHPTRQWCGVWNDTGGLLVWLSSGGELATIPNVTGIDSVALVGANSVGGDFTDREFTRVLMRPVTIINFAGQQVVQGNYAYWVGDEGVKLSLVVPNGMAPVSGGQHGLDQYFPSLAAMPAALANIQEYGQVRFVVTSAEKSNVPLYFHSLGRAHFAPNGTQLKAGYLNVNSSSARYWSGVGATYNRLKSAGATTLDAVRFGNAMDNATLWSNASSGKNSNGPFQSVDSFFANSRVVTAITSGVGNTTLLDFKQALQDWLVVRSDTFRIRAYGDAVNPVDPTKIESIAYCEAIVQRTPDLMPGFGRRFVITYFRWLGPDDI